VISPVIDLNLETLNPTNAAASRARARYNMIPNLFWSAINLAPISVYCYTLLQPKLFWIFLGTSLFALFLPNKMLDRLRIGRTRRIYKRLGVHWVNKITQNGELINKWVRKKYPDHKAVTPDRASISKLISQSYLFEKFHLIVFLFFGFTNIHALVKGHWGWAVVILLTNIAYNVYPNLLQQYMRMRLSGIKMK
jgi:hypothetical protein